MPYPLLPAALLPPIAVLLHPGILALGAALAAVPLIIHLLSRRRVRPVRWAAMNWLLAALKKHQRRLRLENLLILLLRMAALILLGLGLSRLVLSDSMLTALARPKRSVVMLLDTSFSTAAREGARSVSERVRLEADRVLSSLGSDDTVVVVLSNDVRAERSGMHPQVLVPRVVGREGASRAKEALGSLRPSEAPASWPEALAACSPKALLRDEDLNRTLVWITDLQAVDWHPSESAAKSDPMKKAIEELLREKDAPAIEIVDVGGIGVKSLPNLAVTELVPDAGSDLFQGHGFGLQATVANHGPRIEGAMLRVFLDESLAPAHVKRLEPLRAVDPETRMPGLLSVGIDIDASQSFKSAGAHSVRVEVSPPESNASADAIGLDSRRYLALDVRSTLKLLCWVDRNAKANTSPDDILRGLFQGDASRGDVFSLAFAGDEGSFRSQLSSLAPDCVVLANRVPLGPEAQRDLIQFVRGGGALMVFVGDHFNAQSWNAAFIDPKESRLLPFRYGEREVAPRSGDDPNLPGWFLDLDVATPHRLSQRWIADKVTQAFLKDPAPKAYGRFVLLPAEGTSPRVTPSPGIPPGEDAVVLRFKNPLGGPEPVAMAEAQFGQGHVLCASIGLDDNWLDPGIWPFIPVVLNDGALLLTRQSDAARNITVGTPIQGPIPRDATNPLLAIPGRGEEPPGTRAAQDENERPQIVYERVGTSGIWRLTYDRPSAHGASGEARKGTESFAVNVDPRESSLLRLDHSYIERLLPDAKIKVMTTYEEVAAAREEARQGELSPWILLIVALLLLLEPFLAMRFGRHGHTAS